MQRELVARRTFSETLENQTWLDRIAVPIQNQTFKLLMRNPTLRTILDGTWLGHPLHAALTDFAVGAWAAAMAGDVAEMLGNSRGRATTDLAHKVGFVAALSAVLAGLADWSYTAGPARRIGLIHALNNDAVIALYGASLVARGKGDRGRGRLLSTIGFGMLMFGAWLGGHLAYRFGIGVNRAAFENAAREWIPVFDAAALHEGDLVAVDIEGAMPVLLTLYRGQIHAISNTCTHMGCSLVKGRLEGDEVMCPCHGSRFRITDGQVTTGPATVSEPHFEVRVRDGRIEVRKSQPEYGHATVRHQGVLSVGGP